MVARSSFFLNLFGCWRPTEDKCPQEQRALLAGTSQAPQTRRGHKCRRGTQECLLLLRHKECDESRVASALFSAVPRLFAALARNAMCPHECGHGTLSVRHIHHGTGLRACVRDVFSSNLQQIRRSASLRKSFGRPIRNADKRRNTTARSASFRPPPRLNKMQVVSQKCGHRRMRAPRLRRPGSVGRSAAVPLACCCEERAGCR